jgi:hypothetical protein
LAIRATSTAYRRCGRRTGGSLAVFPGSPAVPFGGLDQIENPDIEVPKDLIGHLDREEAVSFQYVMEMRLAYTGDPGESALGNFAALYTAAQMVKEALLKVCERHSAGLGVFLVEIGY